ncbi:MULTISPECIES: hypothetical protein [unclassified Pantoea]|nr:MULTISPECIES: hypothetical protein [unclassified Pantoea]MCA1174918.1 hypothetical protein [Pantoea sp. alder69]MCA1249880.1 hypothetical protein [Pantoea sp. alder70]MCA1264165.1 hypothetical protein [Pantoea sp. alder81]
MRTQKRCMGYIAIVVDDYDRAIEPREEEYGTVVVFEDLYGNRWDLYQNK